MSEEVCSILHETTTTDSEKIELIRKLFNCLTPQPQRSAISACDTRLQESTPEVCNSVRASTHQKDCHIIGAGPAGLFTALFLSVLHPQLTIKIYEARSCKKNFSRNSLLLIDTKTGINKFLKETLKLESKCTNCVRAGRLQEELTALCVRHPNITLNYEMTVSADTLDAHRGSLYTVDATGARLYPHAEARQFGPPVSIILAYVRGTNEKLQVISNTAPKDYQETVIDLAKNLREQNQITMQLQTGLGVYKYGRTATETYYYVLLTIIRPFDNTSSDIDATGKKKRLTVARALSGCPEAPHLKNDLLTLLHAWLGDGVCVINLESTQSTDLKAPRIIPYFNTLPGTLWSADRNLYSVGDSYKAPKWIFGEGIIQSILTSYAVACMIKDKHNNPPFYVSRTAADKLVIKPDYNVSSNMNNLDDTFKLIKQQIVQIQNMFSRVSKSDAN